MVFIKFPIISILIFKISWIEGQMSSVPKTKDLQVSHLFHSDPIQFHNQDTPWWFLFLHSLPNLHDTQPGQWDVLGTKPPEHT